MARPPSAVLHCGTVIACRSFRRWRAAELACSTSVVRAPRVPLVELGAAAIGAEPEDPDVVVLGLRGAGEWVEEPGPPVSYDQVAVDRDRLVLRVVASGRVEALLAQPLSRDRGPAAGPDAERVHPERILGPQVGDRGWGVRLPGADVGVEPCLDARAVPCDRVRAGSMPVGEERAGCASHLSQAPARSGVRRGDPG